MSCFWFRAHNRRFRYIESAVFRFDEENYVVRGVTELSLMKGDEVVELGKELANFFLFSIVWDSDFCAQ